LVTPSDREVAITDRRLRIVPDCVRLLVVETPGGPLAALEAQPAGSTRASAVFVPGFGGSKEDFIPMLTTIASAGYRVVCFDQRGQYESAGPNRPDAYSTRIFAKDLFGVIESASGGQPVHLLGHSFGGLVARSVTITAPSCVRSLVLLDSGPDGASLSRRRLLRPLTWIIRLGTPKILAALMTRGLTHIGVPTERLPWLRYRLLRTNRANLIGICRAMAAEPDLVGDLAATGVPVLVVCGEKDYAWSAKTQADMARRLGARMVVIRKASHTPNEDQPQATVAALLEFWQTVDCG
jgi:pimeloyl-ACP methyl ester carboxylesterase